MCRTINNTYSQLKCLTQYGYIAYQGEERIRAILLRVLDAMEKRKIMANGSANTTANWIKIHDLFDYNFKRIVVRVEDWLTDLEAMSTRAFLFTELETVSYY